eukprot:TRINITY_DN9756_c0_g4_i1.p1 TRINITY_DN9756_c0_g4~~TRINITY_DN9756_c0_g4_i1.p1  ORF type:complete len:133 (+),score=16.80 TRINITY_DN9756_c0_g4_i1:26-400(+)
MAERQMEAMEYLEEHKIAELIENMTSQLMYYRPDDPKSYLAAYLDKLMGKTPDSDIQPLYNSENAKAVFRTFDPSGKGVITLEQYNTAMNTLMVSSYNREPKGFVEDRVTLDTFVEECEHAFKA